MTIEDRSVAGPRPADQDVPFAEGIALGSAIRRARAGKFTLAQLSERSGISVGLLSLIERGRGNPSFKTMGRIASALGVPILDLVAQAVEPETAFSSIPADRVGGSAGRSSMLATRSAAVVRAEDEGDGPLGWQTSMILRSGQEARVHVLDGALEVRMRDRTGDEAAVGEEERRLSVDISVRATGGSGVRELPPIDDPRWTELARGARVYQPTSLAGRMLITHVVRCVRQDPSSSNVERWVSELHGYFVKYEAESPDDLAQIFG
jgi:transcriptional regulator with XRE-family HTH domain